MNIKKMLGLVVFVFTLTLTSVCSATVNGDYAYTTYDDEGYDLITGNSYDNISMSRTNRVEIARNSLDDRLYFDDDNFSHVLFFNSSNIYMGYANGDGSTLELSTFIGDLIPDSGDYYIDVPDGARKFALMNYNYDDVKNSLAYIYPSIDDVAYDTLSYRNIFSGNNLIDDLPDVFPLGNDVYWNSVGKNKFEGLLEYGYYNSSTGVKVEDLNFYRSANLALIEPSKDYYISDSNDWVFNLYFYDANKNYISPLFNKNAFTSPSNAMYVAFNTNTSGQNDLDSLVMLNEGTTSAVYEEYERYNLLTYPLYSIDTVEDSDSTQYIGVDYNDVVQSATNWTSLNGLATTKQYSKILTSLLGYDIPSSGTVPNISLQIGNDIYPVVNENDGASVDSENVTIRSTDGGLRIRVVTATYPTSADFETYLQANDVTFIYEFATPVTRLSTDPYYYYNPESDWIVDVQDVFNGDYPTASELDDMLDYYLKYKDVSADTLTYNDIMAGDVITNGDFADGLTDWLATSDAILSVVDGVLIIEHEPDDIYAGVQQNYVNVSDVMYVSYTSKMDYDVNGSNYITYYSGSPAYLSNTSLDFTTQSMYISDAFDYVRVTNAYSTGYVNRVVMINMTNIFTSGLEYDHSLDFIDDVVLTWIDPYADDYPVYYQAGTLIGNTAYYKYDDTPADDPDFQNSFDDKIESIGIDTPQERLFGAFLIMAVVAVGLGLSFKSVPIVIIAELSLIFIFTVLGWFSLWFILIIALTFVLLLLIKGLKGSDS